MGLCLLRSYNHLLFKPIPTPFPLEGLGVDGRLITLLSMILESRTWGDDKPEERLLVVSRPPPVIALCSNGLMVGEKTDSA